MVPYKDSHPGLGSALLAFHKLAGLIMLGLNIYKKKLFILGRYNLKQLGITRYIVLISYQFIML